MWEFANKLILMATAFSSPPKISQVFLELDRNMENISLFLVEKEKQPVYLYHQY